MNQSLIALKWAFTLCLTFILVIGCGKEDVLDTNDPTPPQSNQSSINGLWICKQQKYKDNAKNHVFYNGKRTCFIDFWENDSCYINNPEKVGLLNLNNRYIHRWSVKDNILTLIQGQDTINWDIVLSDSNTLQLSNDSLTAIFEKEPNGYTPFKGDKVAHIEEYRLVNNVTKNIECYYDFEYDSNNRVTKYIYSDLTGNGNQSETYYRYNGNLIISFDNILYQNKVIQSTNQMYWIGKEGYAFATDDVSEGCEDYVSADYPSISHDDNGYLINYNNGEYALSEIDISVEYNSNEAFITYDEWGNNKKYSYLFNMEAPNNSSINLNAIYTYTPFFKCFKLEAELFDFIGKRHPNMILQDEKKENKDFYKYRYSFERDKEGRISKIIRDNNISPLIWEIYYDNETPLSPDNPSEKENNPGEAIDLGLSVKWSSWNLGATSPSDKGLLYGWGMPNTKPGYQEYPEGYKIDTKNISNTKYDIASTIWGNSWRIPTYQEMRELKDKCTWEVSTLNGVRGVLVTGPNKNSIFLPVTGYENSIQLIDTEFGYYWSDEKAKYGPIYFYIAANNSMLIHYWHEKNIYQGTLVAPNLHGMNAMAIRPVQD